MTESWRGGANLVRNWMAQVARTNDATADAMVEVLSRGLWFSDGVVLAEKERRILNGWVSRLRLCSQEVYVRGCDHAGSISRNEPGSVKAESWCCQVPCCPRHQRRRSAAWVERAKDLWARLPNKRGKGDHRPEAWGRWKMVTASLKHTGDIARDCDQAIKLRAKLRRYMANHFGQVRVKPEGGVETELPAFGAIEMSGTGHVHLHFLVYCRFADVHELRGWLKKNWPGSWYVDVRDIQCKRCRGYNKKRKAGGKPRVLCNHDEAALALVEALKYAAAPVVLRRDQEREADGPCSKIAWPNAEPWSTMPEHGTVTTRAQLRHAEQLVRFYLAMNKRHRVETYGAARERARDEDERAEIAPNVADSDPQQGRKRCPTCQSALRVLMRGARSSSGGYTWARSATAFGLTTREGIITERHRERALSFHPYTNDPALKAFQEANPGLPICTRRLQ